MNQRIKDEEMEYEDSLSEGSEDKWPGYLKECKDKINEMNRIRSSFIKLLGSPKIEEYPNF